MLSIGAYDTVEKLRDPSPLNAAKFSEKMGQVNVGARRLAHPPESS